jgi:hypothetical protein
MGGFSKKYDKTEFIRRANIIHNNIYDYTLSDYKNSRDKIDIICPEHGIFTQMPYNHLLGKGCHHCSRNQKITIDDFILKAKEKHNSKYNYPDRNYINNVTTLNIECPEHGLFKQAPGAHLKGIGCSKCSGNRRLTIDEFIDLANKKHNNLYSYPDKNYKNYDSKLNIDCSKHGIFTQTVRDHLTGRGCPVCRNSKGELKILEILKNNKIKYKSQHTFSDLKHKSLLKFDFAVFDNNGEIKYLIEYNGQQHYDFKKKFHKDYENFVINQYRDELKIEYCNKNKIKLYIIRYDQDIESEMYKIMKEN